MKSADPIETGTATHTAIRAMTTEPKNAAATPNDACAPFGDEPRRGEEAGPHELERGQGLNEEEPADGQQDGEGEESAPLRHDAEHPVDTVCA